MSLPIFVVSVMMLIETHMIARLTLSVAVTTRAWKSLCDACVLLGNSAGQGHTLDCSTSTCSCSTYHGFQTFQLQSLHKLIYVILESAHLVAWESSNRATQACTVVLGIKFVILIFLLISYMHVGTLKLIWRDKRLTRDFGMSWKHVHAVKWSQPRTLVTEESGGVQISMEC